MGKHRLKQAGLALFCLGLVAGVWADPQVFTKRLLNAKAQHQAIPNLSKEGLIDMGSAYQVQADYVHIIINNDEIAGFKAGMTTYDMQNHFGILRPVFGVLFKSGDLSSPRRISLKHTHRIEIETELGFITKAPIRRTVQSITELKSYIGQIVPVIELPDLGFAEHPFNTIDLVAGNTGSHAYILDPTVNWLNQDINHITASLLYNGIVVNQGLGVDAMGDQWEALRWLVNQVIAQGWTIEKGHLLLTGCLGHAIKAEEGVYVAYYDDQNKIEFHVMK